MMQCQLCKNIDGPFEFADVYDDGRAKVMLICEDCAKTLKKLAKNKNKCSKCSPIEKMGYICDDCERRNK